MDKEDRGEMSLPGFRQALLQLNIGPALDTDTTELLIKAASCERHDKVDYRVFIEALRAGRVGYASLNPKLHHRALPDTSRPLGPYFPMKAPPFGVLDDAGMNLAAFDSKIDAAYKDFETALAKADAAGTGQLDRLSFARALHTVDKRRRLNMTDREINDLFNQADDRGQCRLDWRKFMSDFRKEPRLMLDLLTPKRLRCNGPPWAVLSTPPAKPLPPRIHGFSQWLTADSVVLG
eukprot:jgi/Botrbrau1/21822/Bobra.0190s0038.1